MHTVPEHHSTFPSHYLELIPDRVHRWISIGAKEQAHGLAKGQKTRIADQVKQLNDELYVFGQGVQSLLSLNTNVTSKRESYAKSISTQYLNNFYRVQKLARWHMEPHSQSKLPVLATRAPRDAPGSAKPSTHTPKTSISWMVMYPNQMCRVNASINGNEALESIRQLNTLHEDLKSLMKYADRPTRHEEAEDLELREFNGELQKLSFFSLNNPFLADIFLFA